MCNKPPIKSIIRRFGSEKARVNKGADQLPEYSTADPCLLYRDIPVMKIDYSNLYKCANFERINGNPSKIAQGAIP